MKNSGAGECLAIVLRWQQKQQQQQQVMNQDTSPAHHSVVKDLNSNQRGVFLLLLQPPPSGLYGSKELPRWRECPHLRTFIILLLHAEDGAHRAPANTRNNSENTNHCHASSHKRLRIIATTIILMHVIHRLPHRKTPRQTKYKKKKKNGVLHSFPSTNAAHEPLLFLDATFTHTAQTLTKHMLLGVHVAVCVCGVKQKNVAEEVGGNGRFNRWCVAAISTSYTGEGEGTGVFCVCLIIVAHIKLSHLHLQTASLHSSHHAARMWVKLPITTHVAEYVRSLMPA